MKPIHEQEENRGVGVTWRGMAWRGVAWLIKKEEWAWLIKAFECEGRKEEGGRGLIHFNYISLSHQIFWHPITV